MNNTKRWLLLFIILALVAIFFNLRFLGFATFNNTHSEVTVRPPNLPPNITRIDKNIYVCEMDSLFYLFDAVDPDADALAGGFNPASSLFFVLFYSQSTPNDNVLAIISGIMRKNLLYGVNTGSRLFQERVYVYDGYNTSCCYDYENINITMIEINNPPDVEDIGVQTVYTSGEGSEFNRRWYVDDKEFDYSYGTLTYNISIVNSTGSPVNLFGISQQGFMSFIPDNDTVLDTYNITLCVNDTGLTNTHPNITNQCLQDGSSFTRCDDFTLTVTDENRPPEFSAYYPGNLSYSKRGTETFYFNITKYDPDGTIPDSKWYLDGREVASFSGSSVDEYSYNFGCGTSGPHNLTVVITDGLLNASLSWNLTVIYEGCVVPPSSSGGGSGGGGGGGGEAPEPFIVRPEFITTSVLRESGKDFSIVINNTGRERLNFSVEIENLTEMAILNEEAFALDPGEGKVLKLYLYALKSAEQGVYFGDVAVRAGGTQKDVKIVLEVKEREPLFDVKVIVPREFKVLDAGDDLNVTVNMLNVGLYGTAVDVELYLYTTNLDKILIYERQKETLAVETNLTIGRSLFVPYNTPAGTYLVMAEAKYNNITISTYDTFSIREKKYVKISYVIIVVAVLVLILIILFIIYKRRKDKQERGYRR